MRTLNLFNRNAVANVNCFEPFKITDEKMVFIKGGTEPIGSGEILVPPFIEDPE